VAAQEQASGEQPAEDGVAGWQAAFQVFQLGAIRASAARTTASREGLGRAFHGPFLYRKNDGASPGAIRFRPFADLASALTLTRAFHGEMPTLV
jgi:hypothetical protein